MPAGHTEKSNCYYPVSNNIVERFHQHLKTIDSTPSTFEQMLKKICKPLALNWLTVCITWKHASIHCICNISLHGQILCQLVIKMCNKILKYRSCGRPNPHPFMPALRLSCRDLPER
ncbi:hypothetical protein CEXT_147451 [Caerostris extrusa]|uniref:Transposase n=1 Tax=Caerostris extrusa TaxID=172846 RepID=A0AAV4PVT3_CAEEX|nr:hypothetical protein CEXT_147451 [Caerostris extrusa]